MGERRAQLWPLVLHQVEAAMWRGGACTERGRKPKGSEKGSIVQVSDRQKRNKGEGCSQKCAVSTSLRAAQLDLKPGTRGRNSGKEKYSISLQDNCFFSMA